MTQKYIKEGGDYSDLFKAQVLLGGVLNRDWISIEEDGSSSFDYTLPTLAITGTRDGFTRMSRSAEAYWHQVKNVKSA